MRNFAVVVVTFNSSKTVISTLDSILHQTYKPLELIISDDGSKDDTVEVCKEWAERNKSAFKRIEILTVPKNSGVSANLNRGFNSVSNACDWIKGIAGDDILVPDCLKLYKDFIESHSDAKAIYAAIIPFRKEEELKSKNTNDFNHVEIHQQLSDKNVELQRLFFDYFGQFTMSPTFLIHKEIHEQIPFDERVAMIEDVPFNYNMLHAGIKLYYCPHATVFYRVGDSLSHQSSLFFNPRFMAAREQYSIYYKTPKHKGLLASLVRFKSRIAFIRANFFYVTLQNKSNRLTRFLFVVTEKIIAEYSKLLLFIFKKTIR